MNPMCPNCGSKNVVSNGTCTRKLEKGIIFRVQRYISNDCRYSFVAWSPIYGYGKHFPDDVREKSIRSRIKTSLKKAANLFRLLENIMFTLVEKYRALLKDSKTGNFVESFPDDLSEGDLMDFFVRSIPKFSVYKEIYVTTDGFHYSSILRETWHILGIGIKRQRCLFHIEKDMAHRIRDSHKENDLDMSKKVIMYMFSE